MSEILFNKFEKEKKVIELHLEGKTIRDIAKEVHMSFRDISNIIKEYERKKRVETKREENIKSNKIKKLSLSSRAFILFRISQEQLKEILEEVIQLLRKKKKNRDRDLEIAIQ